MSARDLENCNRAALVGRRRCRQPAARRAATHREGIGRRCPRICGMYRAPLKDLQFVLHDLIGDAELQACRDLGDYSADLADSVLAEAGRFAESVLDPLYRTRRPRRREVDAARRRHAAGLQGGLRPVRRRRLAVAVAQPGVRRPGPAARAGARAVEEMWTSANLRFKLCPMLTHGAIEALEQVGTPAQQQTYLPKMISGEWTGTMNLTEPQAGSRPRAGAHARRAARATTTGSSARRSSSPTASTT